MAQLTAKQPVAPASSLSADDLRGDLIQPSHPLFGIVWVNPERLSGAPCFAGTRVPVKNLFDYLEGGERLEDFLKVSRALRVNKQLRFWQISRGRLLELIESR